MLKLTYTENGFYLEHLEQSLEEWVSLRVLLALRSGTSLCVEPSTAAFLLPKDLPGLADFEDMITTETGLDLEISACDTHYLEINLNGTWIATESDQDEGLFVCVLGDRCETLLYQIWQAAQLSASVLND